MRSKPETQRVHAGLSLVCAVAATLFASACTEGKSYILVTMQLKPNAPPIANFAMARVTVSTGLLSDDLVYPTRGEPTNELTAARDVSFSVSFSDSLSGDAQVSVVLVNAAGVALGSGSTALSISPGRVANATVEITPLPNNPTVDGGMTDALSSDAFPNFACTPNTAGGCGPNQTCGVSCMTTGEPQSICLAAGTKQPGELCMGVGDCAPGSQCLEDRCGSDVVRVCRRYCSNNNDCPTGGVCYLEIQCASPPRPTGVKICSQPCDPRGTAKTGCAEGLRCFLFDSDVTDCNCTFSAQMKGDGAACTNFADCLPGFMCVREDGASGAICRAICRLDDPGTCVGGYSCRVLKNPTSNVFGACEP